MGKTTLPFTPDDGEDYISRSAAIEEIHKGLLELFDYVEDVEEPFTYTDIKLLEANKKLTDRIRALRPVERGRVMSDDYEKCFVYQCLTTVCHGAEIESHKFISVCCTCPCFRNWLDKVKKERGENG